METFLNIVGLVACVAVVWLLLTLVVWVTYLVWKEITS